MEFKKIFVLFQGTFKRLQLSRLIAHIHKDQKSQKDIENVAANQK